MPRAVVLYNDDAALAKGEEKDRIAFAGSAAAANAIASALVGSEFEPIIVPAGATAVDLAAALDAFGDGIVFNVCESFFGLPRLEYAVAALLELLRLPYTGSPPLTLALAQDKHTAKTLLAAAGLPVARSAVLARADDPLPEGLAPPLFVKPRFEDASHGISEKSVCASVAASRERAGYLLATYGGDALVEEFLPGREFNVGVLFEAEVLPLAEIEFELPPGVPQILTYDAKWDEASPYYQKTLPKCPAENVPPALAERIAAIARGAFQALGCRDYARVDVRLDSRGEPKILEVNPNPDLSPDAGLARAAGRGGFDYDDLVARIARRALARKPRGS